MAKSPGTEGSTTRLSEPPPAGSSPRSRLLGLARLSLALLAACPLPGCLIEDPPPLQEAKQTAPRLDYQGASPFLDQIIVADVSTPIPFTIPVRSEDAGEPLVGYLLLDYVSRENYGAFMAAPSNLAPSTLNDREREFRFVWSVPPQYEGCHRITLLAGHASTLFDLSNIVNTADLAVAHWWANLNVAPEEANILRNCPDASRSTEMP